jgi:hypothetical protein
MLFLDCILLFGMPGIPLVAEALRSAAEDPVPGRVIRCRWTAEPLACVPNIQWTQDERDLDVRALLKVAPANQAGVFVSLTKQPSVALA